LRALVTGCAGFAFVSNAVAAFLAAGKSVEADRAYNVGGGTRVGVNQVIETLGELVGRTRVQHVEAARGDVRHTSADKRLARQFLSYPPGVDLRQGWPSRSSGRAGRLSRSPRSRAFFPFAQR
jgi:nucleoside-diphosphate-sugar epimerase